MENMIQTFVNEEFGTVRTLMKDGQPWFVAKDVAVIIGYSNPRKAVIDHVDDEDKDVLQRQACNSWYWCNL